MDYWNGLITRVEFYVALQYFLRCYANKSIARGIWYTYIRSTPLSNIEERYMSTTTALAFTPSATLLSRLVAAVDRGLLAYAEITIRNGDILRCCV